MSSASRPGKRLTVAFSGEEVARLNAYREAHKLEGGRLPTYSDAIRDIVASALSRAKEPTAAQYLSVEFLGIQEAVDKARADILAAIDEDRAMTPTRKGWFEWLQLRASALIQALRTARTRSA